MARFAFIGDVHGRVDEYLKLIYKEDYSIALGDMGIGFRGISYPIEHAKNHKFICGNHDNPKEAAKHPACLGRFGIWNGIFFISGAASYDSKRRTEDVDWFREEELSMDELTKAIEMFEDLKPKIVVSHDGPQFLVEEWFGIENRSRTRVAMELMLKSWSPEYWFFGHHHKAAGSVVKTCRFRCLEPLETYSFDWHSHNRFLDNICPFVSMNPRKIKEPDV